ncbi:GDSL lipolytic enzyme [Ranunculus cassubicifolius]
MASVNSGCVEWVNNLVNIFNAKLLQLTKTLNDTFPDAFLIFQDTFTFFHAMIKNPTQYGFSVANQACCGSGRYGGTLTCLPLQSPCLNRDEYIFWDSFHPTQAVNAIVADRCYYPNTTDCYPISISELARIK